MNGKKQKLVVIDKSQNSRCFKEVKTLLVDYKANKSAWMTAKMFKDCLFNWDKEHNRNILLLIDNYPAHIIDCINVRYIKVIFLPANTTSIIQPCDQGIIRTFKAYYRSAIRGKVLTVIDNSLQDASRSFRANDIAKNITILDAIHLVKEARSKVSAETIRNCFFTNIVCLKNYSISQMKSIAIGLMWTHILMLQRFKLNKRYVMR